MIITEEKDFESSENLVHKIFNVKKDLPEQVFDKEFSNFTCEEFDWTESPDFWETTLKPLGQFFQDTHIIMTVLDADLRNYYLRTFGFYTTIKMPLTMTGEKYWEVLHTGPQESPQDAPFESANNVV